MFQINGVEFLYIKSADAPGYAVLAKRDFDETKHELFEGEDSSAGYRQPPCSA